MERRIKVMELFDKRFVRFMWDDELEEKVCFAADNMENLIFAVENDGKCAVKTNALRYSGNNVKPFHAYMLGANSYTFAYYDPNYKWKKAFNEGEKIQYQHINGIEWLDVEDELDIDATIREKLPFRFKPEEKEETKDEVNLIQETNRKLCLRHRLHRPYESSAEMIADFIDRFKVNCPSYAEPLIWVRLKVDTRKRLIVAYGDNFVEIGNKTKAVTLQHLFKQYEFLDGSPCGMEC